MGKDCIERMFDNQALAVLLCSHPMGPALAGEHAGRGRVPEWRAQKLVLHS